ncbi:MAG: hypothetical protein WD077_09545 [Bacteroidia bacterium]
MNKYAGIAFSFLLLLTTSCKTDDDKDVMPGEPVSIVPYIELEEVTPHTVKQFEDRRHFFIFYRDGDGDLGHPDADSLTLYITDNRFPLTEAYHIPPSAPEGSDIAIQGVLEVVTEPIMLKDENNASEQVTYTVRLRDRAGNWSNEVTSENLTVEK